MIKDYKFTEAMVNLVDEDDYSKICNISLEINDEEYIKEAKKICDDKGNYYADGWMIEFTIDNNEKVITNHELFYIGDNGREFITNLEDNETNNKLIKESDIFLLEQIKEYLNNPIEWCRDM